MKTALLVIATGQRYHQYIRSLIESAKKYFVPHDVILWTDSLEKFDDHVWSAPKECLGFPEETLRRYHTFLEQGWLLKQYDQLFYCDVDMLFVAPVGEEVFSDGITACTHPGYSGSCGTPERNPNSLAAIPFDADNKYFCGGFNGGERRAFLDMATEIAWRVDYDNGKGVMAVWHDESHLNKFLFEHPPAKVLDPSYCYPQDASDYYKQKWAAAGLNPTPKILALTKDK